MKIRSQPCFSAAWMIACHGRSLSVASESTSTCAAFARCATRSRILRASSIERRSYSAIGMTRPDATSLVPGIRYSGRAVNTVTPAPAHFANARPACTPFSAVSEPSVGIRMCLYMKPPGSREKNALEGRLGRVLEQLLDQHDVRLLLGGHLLREHAQRGIAGGHEHALEERLRALLGCVRDAQRLVGRQQPEDQLARRGLRRALVEPLIRARRKRRQRHAFGPAQQDFQMAGLGRCQAGEHRGEGIAAFILHALRQLAVAFRRFSFDGDGVRIELGRGSDARHAVPPWAASAMPIANPNSSLETSVTASGSSVTKAGFRSGRMTKKLSAHTAASAASAPARSALPPWRVGTSNPRSSSATARPSAIDSAIWMRTPMSGADARPALAGSAVAATWRATSMPLAGVAAL